MVKVRVTASAAGVAVSPLQGPDDLAERLEQIFARFQGSREDLIPLLQRVQEELGFLPEEAMLRVGRFIRVPEAPFTPWQRSTPSSVSLPSASGT